MWLLSLFVSERFSMFSLPALFCWWGGLQVAMVQAPSRYSGIKCVGHLEHKTTETHNPLAVLNSITAGVLWQKYGSSSIVWKKWKLKMSDANLGEMPTHSASPACNVQNIGLIGTQVKEKGQSDPHIWFNSWTCCPWWVLDCPIRTLIMHVLATPELGSGQIVPIWQPYYLTCILTCMQLSAWHYKQVTLAPHNDSISLYTEFDFPSLKHFKQCCKNNESGLNLAV